MNIQKLNNNLFIVGDKVISYDTHVATIQNKDLVIEDWKIVLNGKTITNSKTTTKHINSVARKLNLNIVYQLKSV